jgi:hypothetical protein
MSEKLDNTEAKEKEEDCEYVEDDVDMIGPCSIEETTEQKVKQVEDFIQKASKESKQNFRFIIQFSSMIAAVLKEGRIRKEDKEACKVIQDLKIQFCNFTSDSKTLYWKLYHKYWISKQGNMTHEKRVQFNL